MIQVCSKFLHMLEIFPAQMGKAMITDILFYLWNILSNSRDMHAVSVYHIIVVVIVALYFPQPKTTMNGCQNLNLVRGKSSVIWLFINVHFSCIMELRATSKGLSDIRENQLFDCPGSSPWWNLIENVWYIVKK